MAFDFKKEYIEFCLPENKPRSEKNVKVNKLRNWFLLIGLKLIFGNQEKRRIVEFQSTYTTKYSTIY